MWRECVRFLFSFFYFSSVSVHPTPFYIKIQWWDRTIVTVNYCSQKPYCLNHGAQNKRHVHFLSHPKSTFGVKTMRLRVFCNYFMYTLITFTTLINIVVSPFVTCTYYFWNMMSEVEQVRWQQIHFMLSVFFKFFIQRIACVEWLMVWFFLLVFGRVYDGFNVAVGVFAIPYVNGWLEWISDWEQKHSRPSPQTKNYFI